MGGSSGRFRIFPIESSPANSAAFRKAKSRLNEPIKERKDPNPCRYCVLCGRRLGKVNFTITQCHVCEVRHPYYKICPTCKDCIHRPDGAVPITTII